MCAALCGIGNPLACLAYAAACLETVAHINNIFKLTTKTEAVIAVLHPKATFKFEIKAIYRRRLELTFKLSLRLINIIQRHKSCHI